MTPDQRRRVLELFEAIVDRESAEAQAWLAREAADDAVVRKEVESLLYNHSKAGDFLNEPIVEMFSNDERLADLAGWDPAEEGAA